MAIIDVLTLYNAKKKAAHAAKTVKHGVSALQCWLIGAEEVVHEDHLRDQ